MRAPKERWIRLLAVTASVSAFPAWGEPAAPPPAAPAKAATPVAEPAKNAGAKPSATITVRIEALRNDQGTVYVSLYDNQKAFADNKAAVQSGQARPKQRMAVVVLENVVPGRYALSFIHDENDNKKLDTNFIGIPKEGFGYSKDAMGRFGPPKFDDAAMVVPAGPVTVVMHAKYM
jgi:uncharacterized protein (DUF2141 family)